MVCGTAPTYVPRDSFFRSMSSAFSAPLPCAALDARRHIRARRRFRFGFGRVNRSGGERGVETLGLFGRDRAEQLGLLRLDEGGRIDALLEGAIFHHASVKDQVRLDPSHSILVESARHPLDRL